MLLPAGTAAAYGLCRFGQSGNLPLALIQLQLFQPNTVMIMRSFLGLSDNWFGLALIYGAKAALGLIAAIPPSSWASPFGNTRCAG